MAQHWARPLEGSPTRLSSSTFCRSKADEPAAEKEETKEDAPAPAEEEPDEDVVGEACSRVARAIPAAIDASSMQPTSPTWTLPTSSRVAVLVGR